MSDINMSPKPFDEAITFETFLACAEAWAKGPVALAPRGESLMAEFESAIGSHLMKLRDDGVLSPIDVDPQRQLQWPVDWNNFVQGDGSCPDAVLYRIATPLYDLLSVAPRAPEKARDLFHSIARYLEAGGHPSHGQIVVADMECALTGEKVVIKLEHGWKLVPYKRRLTENRQPDQPYFTYTPLGPVPEPEMVQVSIPVPSGRIMIADWFRFDGNQFTEIVQKDEPQISISSEAGKIARTEFYAQQHGVLHVYVGNSSPSLYADGGRMILANLDEDHAYERRASKNRLASTCTDLWWVTMVDQEVLRAMLRKQQGSDEAGDVLLDKYLKEDTFEVFEVPPGELFMSFPSQPQAFKQFDSPAEPLSLKQVHELHAVLSSERIEWERWDLTPAPESTPRLRARG